MNDHPARSPLGSPFVLASILLLGLAAVGCNKKESTPTAPAPAPRSALQSAEKTSFNEVTARLDPGGSLYAYLHTGQWLEGLSGRVNGWRDAVLTFPDLAGGEREKVSTAFDLLTHLIQRSGVESISGVGISGIALEPGLYQTKFVLQRDTRAPAGGLWTVFGSSPRPLHELDWLPADTVWAAFTDLDLAALWDALVKELTVFAEAKEGLQRLNETVQNATGKRLEDMLRSLGGQYGAILTLSDSKKIAIPTPDGNSLEIQEPGLIIVLKVKDDALFAWIDRMLQENPDVIRSDADGLRTRTLPIPVPLPLALRPTIARHGDHLFLASNDGLVKSLVAVKAGKQPGLKTTTEFARLARGMPTDGNSLSFVSQRLGDLVQRIQTSLLGQASGQGDGMPVALLQKIQSINQPVSAFAIGQNTGEGWLMIGHGTQQPANAIILPLVVAPAAVVAGLTLPALAKAKSKAQSISCVNNLKQMGLAARIYANDHDGRFPPEFLSMTNELVSPKVLICPADTELASRMPSGWSDFDPGRSSYEYVTRGLTESTPDLVKKVLFRCRVHGSECLGDGSVLRKDALPR